MFSSKSMKRLQSEETILSAFQESKKSSIVGYSNNQAKRVLYPGQFKSIQRNIRQCFLKILLYSKRKAQADAKIVYAVFRMFRSNQQKMKFEAIQRMKKIAITAQNQQLNAVQQIFKNAQLNAFRYMMLFFSNKKKDTLKKAFQTIKIQSTLSKAQRKLKLIKLAKYIIRSRTECLKNSFKNIKQSKLAERKRNKMRQVVTIMKNHRQFIFKSVIVKLKRNMAARKEQQLKTDVTELQTKIQSHNATQIQNLKERKKKLEKSLEEIEDEKKKIEDELNQELKQPLQKLRETQAVRDNIVQQNEKIQQHIHSLQARINQSFTFQEVCQFNINNMLLYMHRNIDHPLKKQQLLKSMQTPLLPLNVDVKSVKQQNKVMQELINQYIVIFGPKALEMKQRQIQLPYEYVIKENFLLHKALLTMLSRLNMTKDDIGIMREFAYNAEEAVKELEKCGER